MNVNSGQYPGYYHNPPTSGPPNGASSKPSYTPSQHPQPNSTSHSGPVPNGQNGPGSYPTTLPSNFPSQHPGGPQIQVSHYGRPPSRNGGPPGPGSQQPTNGIYSSNGPFSGHPSNGPSPRPYPPNGGPGMIRYQSSQVNGQFPSFDPNVRQPVPNASAFSRQNFPPQSHPGGPPPPPPNSVAQTLNGPRHFLDSRSNFAKMQVNEAAVGHRPRFNGPPTNGYGPPPPSASPALSVPDLIRPTVNSVPPTINKPPETLNELLRKPINDNSRHLRQVLTASSSNSPAPITSLVPGMPPSLAGRPLGVINGPPIGPISASSIPMGQPKGLPFPDALQPQQALPIGVGGTIVEATRAKFIPPKHIKLGNVDMKRVILSLQSGLFNESKWAIDCLLVLSSTESIKVNSSLMISLLEHYKCILNAIFDDFFETSPSSSVERSVEITCRNNKKQCTNSVNDSNELAALGSSCDEALIKQENVDSLSNQDEDDDDDDDHEFRQLVKSSEEKAKALMEIEETGLVDCNTQLPIVFKDDPKMPSLPLSSEHLERKRKIDIINVEKCDNLIKLRDVNALDISYITLCSDLDKASPISNGKVSATSNGQHKSVKNQKVQQQQQQQRTSPNPLLEVINQLNARMGEKDSSSLKIDESTEQLNNIKLETLCSNKARMDVLLTRCVSLSNILYNLSFIHENARIMTTYPALFSMLSRIIVFKHQHYQEKSFAELEYLQEQRLLNEGKENMEELFTDFPFEVLFTLRHNALGTITNLASELNLSGFESKVVFNLLDGLLHWAVCRSSVAHDSFRVAGNSLQLEALEILVTLSMKEANIDLILATPPYSRLETLYDILIENLRPTVEPALREFSLAMLAKLVQSDSTGARIVLNHRNGPANLVNFIELFDASAHNNVKSRGATPMFTIAHMARRAVEVLCTISSEAQDGEMRFIRRFEHRIRDLGFSHVIDRELVRPIWELLYRISKS